MSRVSAQGMAVMEALSRQAFMTSKEATDTRSQTTPGSTQPWTKLTTVNFRLRRRGLGISAKATKRECIRAFRQITQTDRASTWARADLLNHIKGQREWGDLYTDLIEKHKMSLTRASQLTKTVERFPEQRRRWELGFRYYVVVGSAFSSEAEQDELLDFAARKDITSELFIDEMRRRVRDRRMISQVWPDGKFGVIYCDPPWRYEHVKTESRAIENQYPTMELEEIKALKSKVQAITAKDCALYIWATSPKVEESVSVLEEWGFKYRTSMVWVKDRLGMGYWARQRHELLLIATIGSPLTPDESVRPDSVIQAPIREHSQKPDVVYCILETCYAERPIIELFARDNTQRPKRWKTWGNELVTTSRHR